MVNEEVRKVLKNGQAWAPLFWTVIHATWALFQIKGGKEQGKYKHFIAD